MVLAFGFLRSWRNRTLLLILRGRQMIDRQRDIPFKERIYVSVYSLAARAALIHVKAQPKNTRAVMVEWTLRWHICGGATPIERSRDGLLSALSERRGHSAKPGIGLDGARHRPHEGRLFSGLRFCQRRSRRGSGHRGRKYNRVVQTCRRALNRVTPVAIAREAFIDACGDAGMSTAADGPLGTMTGAGGHPSPA
ncbi:DUF982 domain-containing protein [Sinorhizobium psoraleae]|uniref:DUF982 domain-containing protein n=1 Tax=Sinorhizobium psoraleae TaxID=520838 RepID=UPI0035E3F3E7